MYKIVYLCPSNVFNVQVLSLFFSGEILGHDKNEEE